MQRFWGPGAERKRKNGCDQITGCCCYMDKMAAAVRVLLLLWEFINDPVVALAGTARILAADSNFGPLRLNRADRPVELVDLWRWWNLLPSKFKPWSPFNATQARSWAATVRRLLCAASTSAPAAPTHPASHH